MDIILLYFLLILVLIASIDYVRVQRQLKTPLLLFIGSVLVFFITFRYGDHDYIPYVNIFKASSDLQSLSDYRKLHGEIGYLFLNKIINILGGNEILLFFIVGSVSVFLTIKFYRAYTKYIFIALLIYFSHVFLLREMIQIRSGLAIAIIMFSIPYVHQRRLGPFLTIVLTAGLFHTVSYLFLLVYFLYPYFNFSKRQVVIVLVAGVILGLLLTLERLEKVLGAIGAPTLVLNYLKNDEYNFSLGLLNPVLIKHFLVIYFIYKYREPIEKEVPYFNVLFLSYIIGAFWLSAFNDFAIFSARIATMFSNVEHILIPSLLYLKRQKLMVFLLIVLYSLFSFLSKWNMIKDWSFVFD